MSYRDGKLCCDGAAGDTLCAAAVTHIDDKGFVYCAPHGEMRRHYRRCRKLRPHELRRLQTGQPIAHY